LAITSTTLPVTKFSQGAQCKVHEMDNIDSRVLPVESCILSVYMSE